MNENYNGNRLNVNSNNYDDNRNGCAFGIALWPILKSELDRQRIVYQFSVAPKTLIMKTHNNIYFKIISFDNLVLAWQKARKGKTKKSYVIEFEKNTEKNLLDLHFELKEGTYFPKPLKTFILRDPKTRKISKSDFRDRIVHHAICLILEPIFDKTFIYDSCANRIGKGNLFALKRFYEFIRKVSRNGKQNGWFNNNQAKGYCLKADIKHYFQEVNHNTLMNILKRKIQDNNVIELINKILNNNANFRTQRERESNILVSQPKRKRDASRQPNFTIFCQYLPKRIGLFC